jgi:hypothetical protein
VTYTITHRLGNMERNPAPEALAGLVAELDSADAEHGDVAISDESGWTLSAYPNGSIVWENVEEGEPRYLTSVSRKNLVELMRLVASGDLSAVENLPWRDGYPPN